MTAAVSDAEARREVDAAWAALWAVGSGQAYDATDLHSAGEDLWFTGVSAGTDLGQTHLRRVERVDAEGRREALPDGVLRVCASTVTGRSAVVIQDDTGSERLTVQWRHGAPGGSSWTVPGRVEHLAWSPRQDVLLVLVAGQRADHAGIAGGQAPLQAGSGLDGHPVVDGPGDEPHTGREVWLWSKTDVSPHPLDARPGHCWEAAWCGNEALLVVASDGPGEDEWYGATLRRCTLDGRMEVLRRPPDQIGAACASPDGRHVAWIEGACSDRGLVCGSAWMASAGEAPRRLEIGALEVTHLHWRDSRRLVAAGVVSMQTRVAEVDIESGCTRTLWQDQRLTLGGWLPRVVSLGAHALGAVVEGVDQAPIVAEISEGRVKTRAALASLGLPAPMQVTERRWTAQDGLEIHGLLILPADGRSRPARGWPLLVDVHGGPIHAHRPRWAAHLRAVPVLVARGWAVLLPNPRGSSGRGQDFARRVIGDMGGADAQDLLAGIDSLVGADLVDPARVAITGSSYGGFMSCWLPTQCDRFAAAVALSPVTDWRSQHHGSHIPGFDSRFLAGRPEDAAGPYHARSPVNFAAGCRTPMLLMAGLRDRSTPPEQARYFHAALRAAGGHSVLVSYPMEGHSLRGALGYLDSAARTVAWLERHAGPR